MGARNRLNAAYFHGSVFVAALVRWLMQSWLIFALTLVVLLVGNVAAGEIRVHKRGRKGPGQSV